MTLPWAKISDQTDDNDPNEIGTTRPAFHNPYLFASPNGNFIAGQSNGTAGYQSTWLVDSSVNPPQLLWVINSAITPLGESPYSEPYEFVILAVDDDGDLWGKTGFNDGLVVKLDAADGAHSLEFEWTDDGGKSDGLTPRAIFTFSVTGGTKVLVYPDGEIGNDNVRGLLGTKGTPGLTSTGTGGFYTWDAFCDDNDDVWMAGASGAPSTSMSVKRITANAEDYPAEQSFVMPAGGRAPIGAFRDGCYVGGWRDVDSFVYEHLFSATLDGSGDVATRESDLANFSSPGIVSEVRPLSNPTRFFFNSTANSRIVTDILADLSEGDSFDLDDWEAGDVENPAGDPFGTGVLSPIYLPGPNAFAGARYYNSDYPGSTDLHDADLYLYYLGEPGETGDPTLKVWGFSLDGHDFYCLRVGESETLVYDLTTRQWASWNTLGRDNWRAIVGQNWVGASAATMGRGWTDIVAGDDTEGVLWILDPATGRDDNVDTGTSAFTRLVTGGIGVAGRQTVPCGAVELTLSLGNPAMTGASITLRTSDDLGRSWTDHGAVTIEAADYDAVVEWRALGLIRAPGRLFEFSDNGAAVRIGSADLR